MALNLVVTNAGRAAIVALGGTGAVQIARCGVSSTAVVPSATATALPGEIKRISTIAGAAIAADVIHLVVRDESSDAFALRSFGLYLGDGTLFAVYGQPDPIVEKSGQATLLLAIDVTLANIAAASLTFGATNFLNPPATTDTAGVVELATTPETTAGIDAVRAVTPRGLLAAVTSWVGGWFADVWRASNDGSGSGLDADLLDGRQAAEFALLTGATFGGNVDGSFRATRQAVPSSGEGVELIYTGAGGYVQAYDRSNSRYRAIHVDGLGVSIDPKGSVVSVEGPLTASGPIRRAGNLVWDAANDGAGSGLDADLLDGLQGISVLADRGQVALAQVNAATANGFYSVDRSGFSDSLIAFSPFSSAGTVQLSFGYAGESRWRNRTDGVAWTDWRTIWSSANDGAGSGLDADLLDGRQGTEFAMLSGAGFSGEVQSPSIMATTSAGVGNIRLAPGSTTRTGLVEFNSASARQGYLGFATPGGRLLLFSDTGAGFETNSPLYVQNGLTWHGNNDGAGSGLDADLLDGRQAAEFALLSGATFTGPVGRDADFYLGRFGSLAQVVMGTGAQFNFDRQNRIFNISVDDKNPLLVSAAGVVIGENLFLKRANAGKYLHHADGTLVGDTISRGIGAPSGGADGDFHLEVNPGTGTMRLWHRYGDQWVHT